MQLVETFADLHHFCRWSVSAAWHIPPKLAPRPQMIALAMNLLDFFSGQHLQRLTSLRDFFLRISLKRKKRDNMSWLSAKKGDISHFLQIFLLSSVSSLPGWWIQHVQCWMTFYQMFGSIRITPRWAFWVDELKTYVLWWYEDDVYEDVDVDEKRGWFWWLCWCFRCALVVWSFSFGCGNGGYHQLWKHPCWQGEACGNSPGYGELDVDGGGEWIGVASLICISWDWVDELEICDVSMSSLMVGNLCIFSCFEHMSPTSILWEMGFSGISLVAETIARSLKSGSPAV